MAFQAPKEPKLPKTMEEKCNNRRLIIVLEKAGLVTVKTKRGNYELLNADNNSAKDKANSGQYRPDIVHRCLLTLLDSPLNKAGLLQVYIHTIQGVLIEINPHVRIPRTFKRFCGLMVQLLQKHSIHAATGSSEKLLQLVKNPVTQYFPPGSHKIGTSFTGDLVDIRDFIQTLDLDKPVVYMFGAHAHGKAEVDWADKYIAISQYALSASVALSRVISAYENVWDVL